MLTETLSGKCPCCGYDKLLQRYGSMGYYLLDGCPKCGFGYGSNGHDEDSGIGPSAWMDFGLHVVSLKLASDKVPYPEILTNRIKEQGSIKCNEDEDYKKYSEEFEKERHIISEQLNNLSEIEKRKKVFEWSESSNRSDDVETTIFQYSDEDVNAYKSTNPVIFN